MKYGRINLDQWFTPDEWALACVDDLLEELPELKGREFLEPSAGGGAFIRALETRGQRVSGYDLEPQADGITEADFLLDEVDCSGKVVIGNPPYGKSNSLSRAFAKRAFEQGATHVAFLLILGFMRTSVLQVGRRVEYFKMLEDPYFELPDGSRMKAPAKMMGWIVLSRDELQEAERFFEVVETSVDADSFWLQGVEYGLECEPVVYTKAAAKGIFSGSMADGKRVVGMSYRKLKPTPEDLSALQVVAKWSGNSLQPGASVVNFLLSNPEVYRGSIAL